MSTDDGTLQVEIMLSVVAEFCRVIKRGERARFSNS